jgi:diaminohydroxyphosphoribosylaminopyrimidine deaminase/5-amino-6-(5-phosphoribosylamino)uracil reductase
MPDAAPYESAMREAIALALKGRFHTAPNPCVGAVLVLGDGTIAARGYHERYGGPHAEINALRDAESKGVNPADCTLVVTLEPCNHQGKTPPCADAVAAAGIRRVVIGSVEPTPEASGGARKLRDKGIEILTGVLRRECDDLIAEFITWQATDLPYTTLKLASTLDGRIATRTGHSQWISCPEALRLVHEIRRHAGAVLVGGNTFYRDDPLLTCRPAPHEPPAERQPLAVVVTSRLPDPSTRSRLVRERPAETVFWTTMAAAAGPGAEALRKKGVKVLGLPPLPRADNAPPGSVRAGLDLREGLASLRKDHGCLHVMCEGGGRLGLSLLERNLAGELRLYISPRILADNEAVPLFSGLSPLRIDEGVSLRILASRVCGEGLILTLRQDGFPGLRPAAV